VVWNKFSQSVLNQLKTDNGGFFPQHGEAIFHIRSEAQDISLRSNFTLRSNISLRSKAKPYFTFARKQHGRTIT